MKWSRPGPFGQWAKPGSAGQAVVEFALVVPIFAMLLFGLVDAGRLVYLNSTLSQAAREGARLASVEASWIGSTDGSCNQPGGPICPATVTALRDDVTAAVNRMMVPFDNIAAASVYTSCDATTSPSGNWTSQTCGSNQTGSRISVRVVYTYSAVTPVLRQIVGTINLSGSATMTIN